MMVVLLLMLWGSTPVKSQVNPPEPMALYKIKVSSQPAEAATASGTGWFQSGQTTTIRTSARSTNYTFQYWLKDGEQYSTQQSFPYKVANAGSEFVAVWKYNPTNPSEPSAPDQFRLFLEMAPNDACSFNRTSGAKAKAGQYVTVEAYPNQGFEFKGWYQGDVLKGETLRMSYLMDSQNVTLTARFVYNPGSPGDPASSQTDVDQQTYLLGDANNDGQVTIGDIVSIVNIIAGDTEGYNLKAADANKDGNVSVGDIVAIVNIISGNHQ